MGKFIENMRKQRERSKLAWQERKRAVGIGENDEEGSFLLQNIDRLYVRGGLGEPGGNPVPEQLIYCDSPLAMLLAVRATKELLKRPGKAEEVWTEIREAVPRKIRKEVWSAAEAAVAGINLEALADDGLAPLIEGTYGFIHYVGRIKECAKIGDFTKRQWPQINWAKAAGAFQKEMRDILGDGYNPEISKMFSAWVLINQQSFDRYLLERSDADRELRRQGQDFIFDGDNNDKRMTDHQLFLRDEASHFLCPAKSICFVSRRPEQIYTESGESVIIYRDGTRFAGKLEE
jgi:hypothetical protein